MKFEYKKRLHYPIYKKETIALFVSKPIEKIIL